MPGQEKMVIEHYQKNPSAAQSLKGALYEEKILTLFKSKINLSKKNISITEAEKIITDFNKAGPSLSNHENDHDQVKNNKTVVKKEKKANKTSSINKKIKKVSKK
jgi:trigger factor